MPISSGWNFFEKLIGSSPGLYILGGIICPSLYGALHLLAWNAPFTNPNLLKFWHICGIVVACPLTHILAVPVSHFLSRLDPQNSCVSLLAEGLFPFFWELLSYGLFSVYFLARFWLVIFCIINMALLPVEVFTEPEWSRILFHFGAG